MPTPIYSSAWSVIEGESNLEEFFKEIASKLPEPCSCIFIDSSESKGRELACLLQQLQGDRYAYSICKQTEANFRTLCYNLIVTGTRIKCVTLNNNPIEVIDRFNNLGFVFINDLNNIQEVYRRYKSKLRLGGIIASVYHPEEESKANLYGNTNVWVETIDFVEFI